MTVFTWVQPATAQCLVGPHPWEPYPATFDVMLVATHPDDELVPHRGLLSRLASQGKSVLVVITADAGNSVRKDAARDSVWTSGLRHEPVFLGKPANCFGSNLNCVLDHWGGLDDVMNTLTGLIDQYKPGVLYTHDANLGENGNPEHRATSQAATLGALRSSNPPETMIVHRWPRNSFVESWTPSEVSNSYAALSCHFGTIPQGNDPTFEPDQGFDFGFWMTRDLEDLSGSPDGGDPPGWFESKSGSSMLWDDTFEIVSEVYETKTTGENIHSHRIGTLGTTYEYTGRMKIGGDSTGIGLTLASDFPNSDRYYRLRRGPFLGRTFHLSPHGTSHTSGTTDSGVSPSFGVWYRFRIAFVAGPTETVVRANIWQDGTPEPAVWQIDAVDSSETRLTSGNIGIWAMNGGASWDDLEVIEPTTSLPSLSPGVLGLLVISLSVAGANSLLRSNRQRFVSRS